MRFFSKYKSIGYALDNDNLDIKNVKDIFTRVKFVKEILDNGDTYYEYTMKGNDTAETIAHKLYGDANRYWIVLLANNIIDPYFDMPLRYNSFVQTVINRYGSIEAAQSTIHHYERQTTVKTDKNGMIDSQLYVTELGDKTVNVSTNAIETIPNMPTLINPIVQDSVETAIILDYDDVPITITTTVNFVAITEYDYENDLNENKRNIRLIKPDYIDMIEIEFAKLIGT